MRIKPWRSPRHRVVTDEPYRVEPELLGIPLSSFRRRTVAFLLDLMIFGLVGVLVFASLSVLSFHGEDPDFFADVRVMQSLSPGDEHAAAERDLLFRLLKIMSGHNPRLLGDEAAAALADGDSARFYEVFDDEDLEFVIAGGESRVVRGERKRQVIVGTDVLLGRFDTVFSWAGAFLVWFTLVTRLGRGRTLGKRLLGLRVVRLDGQALSWWDCFSRASGYCASAATFFLGFLEAIRHPNRQALHDKIAGTVVVRGVVPSHH